MYSVENILVLYYPVSCINSGKFIIFHELRWMKIPKLQRGKGEILNVKSVLVALACLVLLGGCRGMYEGFKMSKAEECYRLNYPEQEQCLRDVNVSYDEYEKERTKKP